MRKIQSYLDMAILCVGLSIATTFNPDAIYSKYFKGEVNLFACSESLFIKSPSARAIQS